MNQNYQISGSLDGGGGTRNTLDYSSFTTGVIVDFQNHRASNVHNAEAGYVTNIQDATATGVLMGGPGDDVFTLTATGNATVDGDGGTNTLIGPNAYNVWSITGVDAGTIEATQINGTSTFVSEQYLTGGNNTDIFVFYGNSHITGYLDGGEGTNYVDYTHSSFSPIYVDWINHTAPGMAGWSRITAFWGVTYQMTDEKSRQFLFEDMLISSEPTQRTDIYGPFNMLHYKERLHDSQILELKDVWYWQIVNDVEANE